MISYNSKGRSIVAGRKIIFHRNGPRPPPPPLRPRASTCPCTGSDPPPPPPPVLLYWPHRPSVVVALAADVFNPARPERRVPETILTDGQIYYRLSVIRAVVLSVPRPLITENPEHLCSITQPIIQ